MPRPALAERRRRRRHGRAGGVDVVDQAEAPRRVTGGPERAGDVPPALGEREAALLPDVTRAHEQRLDRERPREPELAREPLGRMVAAPDAAVAVGRDEGER